MERSWDTIVILYCIKIYFWLEYPIPGTNDYPTIETKRPMRTGAEEEYHIRGELGVILPRKKEKGFMEFFIPAPSSF